MTPDEITKLIETYGPLARDEIALHTKEPKWQHVRKLMLGETTKFKLHMLYSWLVRNDFNRQSQVQTLNYLNALRRGGLHP